MPFWKAVMGTLLLHLCVVSCICKQQHSCMGHVDVLKVGCCVALQEVEVLFDDIEEDAMVGPLLGEADQLLMEHGGDEDGSTEV